MRDHNSTENELTTGPIPFEQLDTSHRFDQELAGLLTRFQYQEDGITLTASDPRPLPTAEIDTATPGLEAVYGSGASLVFLCYDDRRHQMINPIETELVRTLAEAIWPTDRDAPRVNSSGSNETSQDNFDAEPQSATADNAPGAELGRETTPDLSLGVVTPHNAQRGRLETTLPDGVTANTVEKYQGGQRDIIAISATVSDPEFARREEQFILNPRRLLVAISRSRLLSIVICSRSLFEVIPADTDRLSNGPVWARLFTEAVGRDQDPAWEGSIEEFIGEQTQFASIPVAVYPSSTDH